MNEVNKWNRQSAFTRFVLGLTLLCVVLPVAAQSDDDPCAGIPERVLARREAFRLDVESALDELLAATNNAVSVNDTSPACTEELIREVASAMYDADREISRYSRRLHGNWPRHPCILNDVRNYERVFGELMRVVYRECADALDVAEIICPSRPVILSNLDEAAFERLRRQGTGPATLACSGRR